MSPFDSIASAVVTDNSCKCSGTLGVIIAWTVACTVDKRCGTKQPTRQTSGRRVDVVSVSGDRNYRQDEHSASTKYL